MKSINAGERAPISYLLHGARSKIKRNSSCICV
jgi:hypothetical protein